MGKTKDLSAFELCIVVGVWCTGLCQELQRLLGFSHLAISVCFKNGPQPKEHIDNLTQRPASLWKAFNTFLESMPRLIEAVLLGELQVNIKKVFLMFCILSVDQRV
jgi:hypothetical protein